ncbi:MAG: DUF4176 domain-containing protein [Bacilli bacterium]|nr:DUF4176 domain-containing protein [Bacilli bacterium]
MKVKNEKYLPLGSIVSLKNSKIKLIIIGYCKNLSIYKEKKCDYIATIYPIGIINLRESLFFNHEQIDKIFYIGYKDETFIKMNEMLWELE